MRNIPPVEENYTVLTKHDRGKSTVMAKSNEEKKNVG